MRFAWRGSRTVIGMDDEGSPSAKAEMRNYFIDGLIKIASGSRRVVVVLMKTSKVSGATYCRLLKTRKHGSMVIQTDQRTVVATSHSYQ